jgi:RNA-directed DNA polymerase
MEIFKEHIEEISRRLRTGKDLSDFTDLLNFIIDIQNKNGAKYRPFSKKRVAFYYFHIKDKYQEFKIPKKSGGERIINAPDRYLLKIQRRINLILYLLFKPTNQSHGFLIGRSIKTNALPHQKKKYVLNMDIQDFFPSVSFFRVRAVLQIKPTEINKPLAHIIGNFCTLDGKLPQGAPTSPVITNIICQKLDRKLNSYCQKMGIVYTRYADDLTFSSDNNLLGEDFQNKIKEILLQEGFNVKEEKTRIRKPNMRQEVTGLVVNEKLNITREYIRNLRSMIHNYKKGKPMPSNIQHVINGKLLFFKMIRGEDEMYKKLKLKLNC